MRAAPTIISSFVPPLQTFDLNAIQSELLHHFLNSTSLTMETTEDASRSIWQAMVPQEVMANDFLLHSVLALSALHKVHLHGTSETNLARARVHHEKAVTLFRSKIQTISPANITAAIYYVMCTLSFSSGVARMSDPSDCARFIDGYISLTPMVRMSEQLLASIGCMTTNSAPSSGPGATARQMQVCNITAGIASLTSLQFYNLAHTADAEERAVYQQAIWATSDIFHCHMRVGSLQVPVLSWCAAVSEHYIQLLQEKRPLALVIYAHYCVLSKSASHMWFISKWPEMAVACLAKLTGPEWEEALKWPFEELGVA